MGKLQKKKQKQKLEKMAEKSWQNRQFNCANHKQMCDYLQIVFAVADVDLITIARLNRHAAMYILFLHMICIYGEYI